MDKKLLKRHCLVVTKTYHGDQWVTVEIEVRGSSRSDTLLKAKRSNTHSQLDNGKLLEGGDLTQSESHPVEFHKVELRSFRHAEGLLSFI